MTSKSQQDLLEMCVYMKMFLDNKHLVPAKGWEKFAYELKYKLGDVIVRAEAGGKPS